MKEFLTLIILFWIPPLIVIFKNILWDTYFWQIKEYRWDRFWIYIRWDYENENRNIALSGIKFIGFSAVTLMLKEPVVAMLGISVLYTVWVMECFMLFGDLLAKNFYRPRVKSIRNILIIGFVLIFTTVLILLITLPFNEIDRNDNSFYIINNSLREIIENANSNIYYDVYLYLGLASLLAVLLDLSSSFIVALSVALTYPLSKLRRTYIIQKARQKISRHKNFVTIAITGSYGKTTTKEILYELLKSKYNVAKTPYNYNTDIGVAKAILSELKNSTQIFIVEMGALRKGEIKNICKILPPDISVVTSIDSQHLGIFGSKKNLFEAKSEIIKYMQKDGLVFINGDDKTALKLRDYHSRMFKIITTKVKTQSTVNKEKNPQIEIVKFTKPIISTDNNLSFSIVKPDKKRKFMASGFNQHNAISAMISIAVAHELNIELGTLANIFENIEVNLPRLSIIKGDNDTLIIDDTYSTNQKGFSAAVEVMNMQKDANKKIVVTRGILELGKHKDEIYPELLSEIRKKFDVLITTDSKLAKYAKRNNQNLSILKVKNEDLLYTIRKTAEPGDIILLEGRLKPVIIEALRSQEG